MESMSKSVMRSELRKAELGLPLIVTVINFHSFPTNLLLSEYSLNLMSYPLGDRAKAFQASRRGLEPVPKLLAPRVGSLPGGKTWFILSSLLYPDLQE